MKETHVVILLLGILVCAVFGSYQDNKANKTYTRGFNVGYDSGYNAGLKDELKIKH